MSSTDRADGTTSSMSASQYSRLHAAKTGWYSVPATVLRTRYGMSGTDEGCGTTTTRYCPIVLRASYAMPGTVLARYMSSTDPHVDAAGSLRGVSCYTISGTGVAYGATPYAVLTRRTVLPAREVARWAAHEAPVRAIALGTRPPMLLRPPYAMSGAEVAYPRAGGREGEERVYR
eukprot:2534343-Rhodomonas_salina.2